jgi:hypothetical protein
MLDLSKVVINNTEKRRKDDLQKARGKDRLFAGIRTPVSSGDRGGESAEGRILRRSGTPRGRLGVIRQHAWSAQPSDWSSVVLTTYS